MTELSEVRYISIAIARPPDTVFDYAGNPENLPQWASGLGMGISRTGDHWQIKTEQGPLRLDFAPPNPYGVLDHTVTLPDGAEIHVPMRVVRNGAGSEVSLTLFRQPGMDDAAFERDADTMRRDLATLKARLEG
jgi:hypothetical protein